MDNNGRIVGILSATTTQFELFFHEIYRALHIWNPLLDIVHVAPLNYPHKNILQFRAEQEIFNPFFWKQVYLVLFNIYLALISLHLAY